ncbi:MAG TPA: histone deacetylase family protein [Acidimicrobiales bacterium]
MRVVHSPLHERHDPEMIVEFGLRGPAQEVPDRVDRILAALATDARFSFEEPETYGLEPILAVHDPDLVAYLAEAWADWEARPPHGHEAIPDTFLHPALREGMGAGRLTRSGAGRLGFWSFDSSTPMVAGTYAAARAAVDCAVTSTDHVLDGEGVAYALCRPPGHHAPRAAFGGFCFFNNVAIAAQHAVSEGAGKVAVLDVDYHHGNGTQQIFYDRGDVLFVSLHADPDRAYPYFTGFADETGSGAGRGTTRNVPLAAGTDDEAFLEHLRRALEAVDAFDASMLFVSLGLDTYRLDPIGDFAVTTDGYEPAGALVASLGLPLVIVQEGGYHLPDLGANTLAWLRGAAG